MQYRTLKGAAAVALVAALAACTPQQNANVLPANTALTASTVSYGTIVSSRAVQLQGGQGSQAAGAVKAAAQAGGVGCSTGAGAAQAQGPV